MWKREEIGRSNKVTTTSVVVLEWPRRILRLRARTEFVEAVVSCNVGVSYIQRKLVDHIQTVNEEVLHVER